MGNTRSVAVFHWKGALPTDAEVGADPKARYSGDFGEQWVYQSCQPIAARLFEAIQGLGYSSVGGAPDCDEGFWYFAVRANGREYRIQVQWTGIGDRDDSFAVAVDLRRGCLASLFMPRLKDKVGPARQALDAILRNDPLVADLQWLTDEQFAASYCEGKPLPPRDELGPDRETA